MEPLQILRDRLDALGCSVTDILRHIPPDVQPEVVLVYTSHLEGLGTRGSDLDCYIITNAPVEVGIRLERTRLWQLNVGDAGLDVEFYTPDYIQSLYGSIAQARALVDKDPTQLDFATLKLLHRLQFAVPILGADRWATQAGQVADQILNYLLARWYNFEATELAEDAGKFLDEGDWESALVQGRQAAVPAVLAYMAAGGVRVVKPKWVWRKLRQAFGPDHEVTRTFWRYLVSGNIGRDNQSEAESLLMWCQDLLIDSQL